MPHDEPYADDISGLWGPDENGALEPARVIPREADAGATPAEWNGSLESRAQPHDEVAKLAEAIAANHVDAPSRAELEAMRSELEGAFTHQLAVALYDLMGASNDRLATAEDHINLRLHEIGERVGRTVEEQAERLAASIELHQGEVAQRADVEAGRLAAEARAELDAVSERVTAVQDDVRALREAVAELRKAVDRQARKLRARPWRSDRSERP